MSTPHKDVSDEEAAPARRSFLSGAATAGLVGAAGLSSAMALVIIYYFPEWHPTLVAAGF